MLDINLACKARTQPLRSIGLKPIDHNMPFHEFQCPCDMCNIYETNKVSTILEGKTVAINKKIQSKVNIKMQEHPQKVFGYYKTILKYLIVPQNKIITRGLNVFIPELVFYKDGQATNLFCCREVDDPVIKRAHKEKLSIHFIQKIMSDRRKKYRQMVQNFLGIKKAVVKKKPMFGKKQPERKVAKDVALIRYTDGHDQLINQNQFNSLMQMRKLDPKWKQIAYLKNYIGVDDPNIKNILVKFNKEDIKYEQLFRRSHTLMKVYAQNIQKGERDYITDQDEDQFCRKLNQQSGQIFAQYLLYKIVSFVQVFHDEKITQITAKFIINQLGYGYLDDVMKLQKQNLVKYTWTNATYEKKISQHEQKVIYSKNINVTQDISRNAQKIGKVLEQQYYGLKQQYGLLNVEQDDLDEIANNQFFKKIYPQVDLPMSEILKQSNMTVDKFRRTYLGFKPSKKPIVRPFTCNMIRSLHKITPQLRSASPHNYISAPKQRSISTAWSSHSGSKLRKSYFTKSNSNNFSNIPSPNVNVIFDK